MDFLEARLGVRQIRELICVTGENQAECGMRLVLHFREGRGDFRPQDGAPPTGLWWLRLREAGGFEQGPGQVAGLGGRQVICVGVTGA